MLAAKMSRRVGVLIALSIICWKMRWGQTARGAFPYLGLSINACKHCFIIKGKCIADITVEENGDVLRSSSGKIENTHAIQLNTTFSLSKQ